MKVKVGVLAIAQLKAREQ